MPRNTIRNRNLFQNSWWTKVAVIVTLCMPVHLPASAAGPADEAAMRAAWLQYTQQKYGPSADAFEALIGKSTPSARLYYYAALACRASNRNMRARQLCQYVIANFGASPEASHCQKLFPDLVAAKPDSNPSAIPDALKGKSVAELMKTEEGRKAIQDALAKKEPAAAPVSGVSPMVAKSKGAKVGQLAFSASDIAADGAGGIDQMYYPNCWFESSMSALAILPRGQKLMSEMIRHGAKEGTYVVRFPGDGVEYQINEEKLEKTGIHDKALWATLIECAQTIKFPDDNGGLLSDGLGYLTGKRAETISPGGATDEDLSRFIDGAVKTQNPIVAGSNYGGRGLVIGGHAYTIIGFDSGTGMVKVRNPHGQNSQRFSLPGDEGHRQFEQLDDGMFKIHITLFKQCFSQVARAFI